MSHSGRLLERNREFATSIDLKRLVMPDRAAMPEALPIVLTCVDPRVDPAGFLGIQLGEAGVLRNVGGRVDERVAEDIAYLAMRLGVRLDVAVIHHTQCGTGKLSEPTFRQAFASRTGIEDDALAAKAVIDPSQTVREDVAKLRNHPLLSDELVASVSGYVFRLETGLVETTVEAASPA